MATRGGLDTDRGKVRIWALQNLKAPADFGKDFDLSEFYIEEPVSFEALREATITGLALLAQRKERGPIQTIKMADLAAALKADSPLEALKSKGYDEKVIARTLAPFLK